MNKHDDAHDDASVEQHERFMHRCIELAGVARSRGNTPVGSVVVIDAEVVSEGIEDSPLGLSITGHAEILACQQAVDKIGRRSLAGATLYTTAEPCFMCSYVIRQCDISLVVYGLTTPTIGGATSSHPILTDPSLSDWSPAPRTLGGVLRSECERLKSTGG